MAGIYFGLVAIACALAAPLAAIGAGIGEGMVFSSAIQGIARQPEAEGRIRGLMFVCFALVEFLFIWGIVVFVIFLGKLPTADQITQMLAH